MSPLASSSAAQAPKSSQGRKKERRKEGKKEGRERRGFTATNGGYGDFSYSTLE